jgi:hypothetical protein
VNTAIPAACLRHDKHRSVIRPHVNPNVICAMSSVRSEFDDLVANGAFSAACDLLRRSAAPLSALQSLSAVGRARALDDHRALAAAVCAACNFEESFEQSFASRDALLAHGAARWAVDTLRLLTWAPANAAAAAAAVRRLGASEDGRTTVGKRGGIATMLAAWRANSRCLEIVDALVVLCSGHLDNVSRLTREDGIELAINVWEDKDAPLLLKKQTLILVGICCVCLPDEGRGATLVPAVLATLTRAVALPRRGRDIAAAAMNLLANVGESCSKEMRYAANEGEVELPGYVVEDGHAVVEHVLAAWRRWPRDRNVVTAATWTLCAMYRANQITLASGKHGSESGYKIKELLALNRVRASTVDTLRVLITGKYEYRRVTCEASVVVMSPAHETALPSINEIVGCISLPRTPHVKRPISRVYAMSPLTTTPKRSKVASF